MSAAGIDARAVAGLVEVAEAGGIGVVEADPIYMNFSHRHDLHLGYNASGTTNPSLADADAIVVVEADVPWYPHLQKPAAEALVKVNKKLAEQGYGLLIHDAYRPWHVTKMFWEATPEKQRIFVADPSKGSRHNRGCAVDLTLYDLKTKRPIEMVSTYDETTARAYPDYPGGTSLQRWHRKLLRDAMEAEGFTVYEAEWWHFDYQDWRKYRIGNVTFEQIGK